MVDPVISGRYKGPLCSSVVRVFAHGAMGCWIDPSWWTQLSVTDLRGEGQALV